ncbi:MAG: hypothetical protein DPW09_30140 [Anaerolineae bacterium]|nr:hypothetical protein [Anaerolineae bacterium]
MAAACRKMVNDFDNLFLSGIINKRNIIKWVGVMDKRIERELLAVAGQLSTREVELVIEYARVLRSTPLSEVSRTYLEMLNDLGASPTELLRVTQATQRVEARLAQGDSATQYYELERRTDDYMQSWLRERGLDYDTTSEKLFDEIIDGIIHRHRQMKY